MYSRMAVNGSGAMLMLGAKERQNGIIALLKCPAFILHSGGKLLMIGSGSDILSK
jgi:hypothetical protein